MIVSAANGESTRVEDAAPFLAALRAGEATAWEAFVRQHAARMLATARRLSRCEDEAQDVVQDAFAQAFKALKSFRAEAQLSTWLHRIVVNAALMRRRAASRRPETSLDDLLPTFETDGHHASPIAEIADDPESLVGRAEVRAKLRRCIAELPETAQILGVSENAVKVRLHRARQALATLFSRMLAGERSLHAAAGAREQCLSPSA
jgi:RNA polymerase sigma-70 factor, ECF subfamily